MQNYLKGQYNKLVLSISIYMTIHHRSLRVVPTRVIHAEQVFVYNYNL